MIGQNFVKIRNSWLVSLWKLGIAFFRENTKCIMSSSFFFEKKITIRIFEKKSNFVLLAFETCQGAIWSSHSVIRVLINLHYHPTLFEAFHNVSFCEISVRFVIIKTGHNFQKLSLCISFFYPSIISYYDPYDDIPIFFSHMNFFINIELWHFYVIFVTLIWCCVCKINYYF